MKKVLLPILLFVSYNSIAQLNSSKLNCGTVHQKAIAIPKDKMDMFLRSPNTTSIPYSVKTYITVFADDNGMNRASTNQIILNHFAGTVNQYVPHGICFSLAEIRQINNTNLNNFEKDDDEDDLAALKVQGYLNVFVSMNVTSDGNTIGGTAFGIPNTDAYLIVSALNINNNNDVSTIAHEIGHVFGLYHTFEDHPWDPLHGEESVQRVGGCSDCDVDGDLICDTPADPDQESRGYLAANTSNCIYTGDLQDECNQTYTPAINNIMSYGDFECITQFTVGQGNRMRYFIETEYGLQGILAQNIVVITNPGTISSGKDFGMARDEFILQPTGGNIIVNGSANVLIQSKKIVLKSWNYLTPGVSGKIHLKNNSYCQ